MNIDCINCKEGFDIVPKDYNYKKKHYPKLCPHCEMPIEQAFDDIREIEGFWEALNWITKNRTKICENS